MNQTLAIARFIPRKQTVQQKEPKMETYTCFRCGKIETIPHYFSPDGWKLDTASNWTCAACNNWR